MSAPSLIIVGAGPAGLCAAINAASEGVSVTLLDEGPLMGGQARESRAIENYPGFPGGITGEDLVCAFLEQAENFGCGMVVPARAAMLTVGGHRGLGVTTDDHQVFEADAILITTGATYRRHPATTLGRFLGRGVSYGLPGVLPRRGHFVVIGGANSAGQAAVALSEDPRRRVSLLSRSPLEKSMSSYLIDRLRLRDNVTIGEGAELSAVGGKGRIEWCELKSGVQVPCDGVFLFLGATPRTHWLRGTLNMDERGFIKPGEGAGAYSTSMSGVFVAGDVRRGSTKRVATAIGEGAGAVSAIHQYLGG